MDSRVSVATISARHLSCVTCSKGQARGSEGGEVSGPKEETGELHLFETESVSPPAYLPADGCSSQAKAKLRGCGGRGREQGVGGSGHAGCVRQKKRLRHSVRHLRIYTCFSDAATKDRGRRAVRSTVSSLSAFDRPIKTSQTQIWFEAQLGRGPSKISDDDDDDLVPLQFHAQFKLDVMQCDSRHDAAKFNPP